MKKAELELNEILVSVVQCFCHVPCKTGFTDNPVSADPVRALTSLRIGVGAELWRQQPLAEASLANHVKLDRHILDPEQLGRPQGEQARPPSLTTL